MLLFVAIHTSERLLFDGLSGERMKWGPARPLSLAETPPRWEKERAIIA